MRISVECGGFTEAADACRVANQVAALVTESLAGKPAAYDASESGWRIVTAFPQP